MAESVAGSVAICATHVYGTPADTAALQAIADSTRIPVVYDAAHGLGSRHDGRPIGGFGAAEVFSMSPTKVVVAGEGGIVATRRADLAEAVRIGRDYGNVPMNALVCPGAFNVDFGMTRSFRVGGTREVQFRAELFNLAKDISETIDLSTREPRRVARLKRQLAAWRQRVGAQTNAPNPNFDPVLHRMLYLDFVPSAFDPLHADAETWARVAEWRKQMDAVLRKPKAPPLR